MTKYYENNNGDIYVLSINDNKYRAVNIKTGGRWNYNFMSEESATRNLTRVYGKTTFTKSAKYIKSATDIMAILVRDGYEANSFGDWIYTKHCSNRVSFLPKFWQYCGKENPGFILDESWVEYK